MTVIDLTGYFSYGMKRGLKLFVYWNSVKNIYVGTVKGFMKNYENRKRNLMSNNQQGISNVQGKKKRK